MSPKITECIFVALRVQGCHFKDLFHFLYTPTPVPQDGHKENVACAHRSQHGALSKAASKIAGGHSFQLHLCPPCPEL